MYDNLGNSVNILKKCIYNIFGVLVRHRFEPMHAFGSVDIIELEVFDMPDPRAAARHWARYITLIFTVPLLLPVYQKSCTIQPLYGILK